LADVQRPWSYHVKDQNMQIVSICRKGLLVLSLSMTAACLAQPASTSKPPRAQPGEVRPQKPVEPQWLLGAVEGFNYSPKGEVESLMLREGNQVVQVVFPPEAGDAVLEMVPVRERVTIAALPDKSVAPHPVYRLVSLTTKSGKQLAAAHFPRKGKPSQSQPRPDEKTVHIDATVKQLNYGRRGEVNGAQIERGDFVHTGADTAVQLTLKIGQKLSVDGVARPMARRRSVIEASTVNGIAVTKRPGPKDQGPGGPGKKTPVAPEQVPASAMGALKGQAGDSELSKLEVESKGGRDVYTAKWQVNGQDHEAKVAGDGSLLETKESVAFEELPETVRNAVAEALPGASELDAKKKTLLKDGQSSIVYEIKARDGGPQGPPLKIASDGTVEQPKPGGKHKGDKGGPGVETQQ
jgi:hypothetical protein